MEVKLDPGAMAVLGTAFAALGGTILRLYLGQVAALTRHIDYLERRTEAQDQQLYDLAGISHVAIERAKER